MDNKDQTITASWLMVIAGVWLLVAPFILGYILPEARTNDMLAGAIIGILGLVRAYYPARTAWASTVNLLAGLWLLAAPFVIGYVTDAARLNDIILGIIVVGLSAWSMGAGRKQIMMRPR